MLQNSEVNNCDVKFLDFLLLTLEVGSDNYTWLNFVSPNNSEIPRVLALNPQT